VCVCVCVVCDARTKLVAKKCYDSTKSTLGSGKQRTVALSSAFSILSPTDRTKGRGEVRALVIGVHQTDGDSEAVSSLLSLSARLSFLSEVCEADRPQQNCLATR